VVAFDLVGAPLVVPGDITPPTLMVGPVTDAMKLVSADRVVGSVDKESLWGVVGFVLTRDIIVELGVAELTPAALVEAVTRLGHRWTVSQTLSAP
jgi:hypothetical protein